MDILLPISEFYCKHFSIFTIQYLYMEIFNNKVWDFSKVAAQLVSNF